MQQIVVLTRVEQIALVCHEANAAYCRSIGDNSQKSWEGAEDWQRESSIKGVQLYLQKRALGEAVLPSFLHEAWLEEKRSLGWKYGAVKDTATKEHPCFVPYAELPSAQQVKDYLFCGVVGAFSAFADADGGKW
jgi:RyR domain